MISKLPPWVWFGGCILALIAGMINAVGFLGVSHQAITHLTGTTTLSAVAIIGGRSSDFYHLGLLVLSFLFGAVVSGYVIQHSALQLGRRYGLVLAIESMLLFAAFALLYRGIVAGEYLAAIGCGLQNAMASSYSGAVIRTTHVSGMITDIGIIIGHWIRGLEYNFRRLRLYSLIVLGFFTGGLLGGILFLKFGYATLLVPAGLTGLAALGYSLYSRT